MKATIEISLYPLHDAYEEQIIAFIHQLRSHETLRVESNGMSTQVFGDYDELMLLLSGKMKDVLIQSKAVFILKVAAGERSPENLPESLKS